jgi:hypothetical protein
MQFAGKKGIAVFFLLVSGAVVIGFGSGLLVGRQFPARRYEQFGSSLYLLDSTTGKVCNPLKDPKETSNLIAQGFGAPAAKYPDYPPACGK